MRFPGRKVHATQHGPKESRLDGVIGHKMEEIRTIQISDWLSFFILIITVLIMQIWGSLTARASLAEETPFRA
jgi:hypothetical protein